MIHPMTDDLDDLRKRQKAFVEARDWKQFHTPKSTAMALSVETSELVELFQWHDNLPVDAYENDPDIRDAVADELADVLIYVLSISAQFDIDLIEATDEKLDRNDERYDEQRAAQVREELSNWTVDCSD